MAGWRAVPSGDQVHVVPHEDLEPHLLTAECHCHPERHPVTNEQVVVHNSFDRREAAENAERFARPN